MTLKSYVRYLQYIYMNVMECSTHAYGIIQVIFFLLLLLFGLGFRRFTLSFVFYSLLFCEMCVCFFMYNNTRARERIYTIACGHIIYRFKWTFIDQLKWLLKYSLF